MVRFNNGELTQAQFIEQLTQLMFDKIDESFLIGSGFDNIDDLPESAQNALEQIKQEQLQPIRDLAQEIVNGRFSEQVDPVTGEETQTQAEGNDKLENRAGLWAATAANSFNEGQINNPDIEFLVWRVGETDHCTDCLRLNGQVHTREAWQGSGFMPQGRSLECGGWRCQCKLEQSEGPSRGNF